jgi:hypothetical protein
MGPLHLEKNMSRSFVSGAILAVLLTLSLPAGATTFVLMEPAELTQISDAVVVGQVGPIEAIESVDGSVSTYVTVTLEESWKGPVVSGEITVKQAGGFIDGVGRVVLGSPSFRAGERVLLFLRRGSDGTLHTSHLAMGKFSVVPDPFTGGEAAVRDLTGARVLSGRGASILPGRTCDRSRRSAGGSTAPLERGPARAVSRPRS